MKLSLGIVGLPNVGKSTLFKALTKKGVDIANYPFTTINPNVGVVAVPDDRLEKIATVARSARMVPAAVEFVDIAGLVKGANRGEGLGNQFLAQIREVAAIVEVLRAFADPEVIHIEGAPDPLRDHEIIETELALKDLEAVEKRMEKVRGEARSGSKEAKKRLEALEGLQRALREGVAVRRYLQRIDEGSFADVVRDEAQALSLLTAKPMMTVVNTGSVTDDTAIASSLRAQGMEAIIIDLKTELEASELSVEERRELGLSPSALDRLIRRAYAILGLVSFFSANETEAHAWTIRRGTKAPSAAGVIHTDFERNFIRADVVDWQTFVRLGGWAGARAKGLVRSEGKEYIVRDGDVMDVKHGA